MVMGGGGDDGYGYSEQGHCRMCGKYGLLYQPDWYCLTCTTHELPGPVVKPGDGGGDSHVCDKCGEIPCVCCHCGGGCHCDCGYSCINCSGSEDPFACPYCGEINCPGDCQRGNGGGGETPETPEPPNDPKDTLIVSDILSMVGYDLQSAKDMIDRIVEIVVQRKPDVYGSFILDRSTILHQIANFKSLINQ